MYSHAIRGARDANRAGAHANSIDAGEQKRQKRPNVSKPDTLKAYIAYIASIAFPVFGLFGPREL